MSTSTAPNGYFHCPLSEILTHPEHYPRTHGSAQSSGVAVLGLCINCGLQSSFTCHLGLPVTESVTMGWCQCEAECYIECPQLSNFTFFCPSRILLLGYPTSEATPTLLHTLLCHTLEMVSSRCDWLMAVGGTEGGGVQAQPFLLPDTCALTAKGLASLPFSFLVCQKGINNSCLSC
jgi:hypothetical protein